jgi:hypothetical protein
MLNRNLSAQTAAQQSSKCSLLFRQAPLVAILMLAAGLFVGCSNGSKIKPIVTGKSYHTYTGKEMPKCLCRFFTENGTWEGGVFEDSCHLFNIGDTLNNN